MKYSTWHGSHSVIVYTVKYPFASLRCHPWPLPCGTSHKPTLPHSMVFVSCVMWGFAGMLTSEYLKKFIICRKFSLGDSISAGLELPDLLRLCSAGWCWFFVRKKYYWLAVAGGWCWFYVRKKYCWLDAAKMKRTVNMRVAHRLTTHCQFVAVAEIAGRSASALRRAVIMSACRSAVRNSPSPPHTTEKKSRVCVPEGASSGCRPPVLADATTCRPPAGNVSTQGQNFQYCAK